MYNKLIPTNPCIVCARECAPTWALLCHTCITSFHGSSTALSLPLSHGHRVTPPGVAPFGGLTSITRCNFPPSHPDQAALRTVCSSSTLPVDACLRCLLSEIRPPFATLSSTGRCSKVCNEEADFVWRMRNQTKLHCFLIAYASLGFHLTSFPSKMIKPNLSLCANIYFPPLRKRVPRKLWPGLE